MEAQSYPSAQYRSSSQAGWDLGFAPTSWQASSRSDLHDHGVPKMSTWNRYTPQPTHQASGYDRYDSYRPQHAFHASEHDRYDPYRPGYAFEASGLDRIDSHRPHYGSQASEHDRYDSYRPQCGSQASQHERYDSYRPQYTPQASAQPTWMSTVKDGRVTKAKSRSSGIAAALVREGEVIGAKAAPIGTDSPGRRLLAKMGWSEGTALGKHRDGRLAPVEQVMRFSHTKVGIQ
ncbi:hypothetical protein CLAFUW4_03150 [Fulvia fulva]|uniref:G-patch domain-containing protein n=1 Tax=Passalora fulva TaxID=5499 RepID=A0A9Q8LA63_PASFU|nr:uncharacterized protein CLAFUR5_03134 [Fulvia fulva]KAK4630930.1 hypothetical protein CLAFUR4_03139 [Fulvia fulva]UJO13745.1 hypothetical protein CLAFUR5_03134 [Fulvia fulva]WPV10643.1 hypothetical protein CLAFUW4_03150 [Fulvia fulva]WPV26890.1 hypothetical protein CLAFUW7_03143 [Fulvia fulva]